MKRYLNLILMAAGNSERYGANKLLEDIGGKPMYRHIFDHLVFYYRTHCGSCRVTVVSQYDEILCAAEDAGFTAVRNLRPQDGISLTIRLGLGAVSGIWQAKAGIDDALPGGGAVFFTADQPYLRRKTVEDFLDFVQASDAGLISAAHDRISGNPVFFDSSYYPELLELTGDCGGKRVMNRHLRDVEWFETGPEELQDIDRPDNIL